MLDLSSASTEPSQLVYQLTVVLRPHALDMAHVSHQIFPAVAEPCLCCT